MSMSKLGIAPEGVLIAGRIPGRGDVCSLSPIPGRLGALLRLLPAYDLTLYPLWPARGHAEWLRRWIERHLAEHPDIREHPDPGQALKAALLLLPVADRRPDDLDAWVELTAAGIWESDPLDQSAIGAAMQRGWALDRAAA